VNHRTLPQMVDAMAEEIEQSSFPFPIHETVVLQTIYLGGGTPSLLTTEHLQQLFDAIHRRYQIAGDAEITLEANPDDINPARLQDWQKLGINRLSVGIQSFQPEELTWMNRAHQAEQAIQCLAWIRSAGYTNFSVDLIFGSPLLSNEQLEENMHRVIEANVPHISCYALTVESGTALGHQVKKGKAPDVDSDKQARQFLQVFDRLTTAGYEGYEISNYALPGFRSQHNSAYWQGVPYGGIGPGAHSYRPGERQWNIANNSLYIQGIQQKMPPIEKEILSSTQITNEYLMTALRTTEGISLTHLGTLTSNNNLTQLVARCRKYAEQNWLSISDKSIQLTRIGRLQADGIAADLFVD